MLTIKDKKGKTMTNDVFLSAFSTHHYVKESISNIQSEYHYATFKTIQFGKVSIWVYRKGRKGVSMRHTYLIKENDSNTDVKRFTYRLLKDLDSKVFIWKPTMSNRHYTLLMNKIDAKLDSIINNKYLTETMKSTLRSEVCAIIDNTFDKFGVHLC